MLANRRRDSQEIEVVRFADVPSDSVQLFDNRIAPLHNELPAGNSSGVQIIASCLMTDAGISPPRSEVTGLVRGIEPVGEPQAKPPA